MKQPKALHLTVMGGLCSRLRAVLGAGDWCQRHGCESLVINWPKQEPNLSEFGGFTVRLNELWDLPDWWVETDIGIQQWSIPISEQTYREIIYTRT